MEKSVLPTISDRRLTEVPFDLFILKEYNIIKERKVSAMSAKNEKVKLIFKDKFARHFYCQHARLSSVRNDKKQATRKMRKINKKICKKSFDDEERGH